jgi:hypothetical protein
MKGKEAERILAENAELGRRKEAQKLEEQRNDVRLAEQRKE